MTGVALKTALITGASRGIGRALCLEALKRGYVVHALVRREGDAPPGTVAHVSDIRDRAFVKTLLQRLAPELNVFIANAGIDCPHNPKDPTNADRVAEVFEVNGTATAYAVYQLAHQWVTAPAQGIRRIAVVSSLAAGRGLPRSGPYIATKTAELALCQSLERDLDRYGIGVSVIQPGFIDTDMSRHQPKRPFLITAERAAEIVWDGLERGRFRIAFPRATALMTWFVNAIPYFIFRRLVMFMQARRLM